MRKGAIGLLAGALLLCGCASLLVPNVQRREHGASSLVDFLYPGGMTPPPHNAMPVLELPLRVGLAFLPPASGSAQLLDEVRKQQVLERVRTRFADRGFVREINVIPEYYLGGQRGYQGLAALQRLYDVDLVALVSWDQVRNQQNNELSLTYLTIVGSFLFPGTSQDVSTLVDLAVVHPPTQSLVLRAGGIDTRKGSSTEVGAGRERHQLGMASFEAAAGRMIENFDAALLDFEEQVRQGTARVQIANAGNGGGGAFDWPMLLLFVPLVLWKLGESLRQGRTVTAPSRRSHGSIISRP